MSFSITFSLIIFSTFIVVKAIPVEDVDDMLAQFTNFTELADDSLGKLKLISDQNPEFISRIEKVGALINLGTNANYSATDQEKVALRILHSFLKQQLPRLGIVVIRIINKLECSLTSENYHKFVTIPMLNFLPVFYAITDPAENRTRWLDTFKAKCARWAKGSPSEILSFFRHYAIRTCMTPAKLQELFTEFNHVDLMLDAATEVARRIVNGLSDYSSDEENQQQAAIQPLRGGDVVDRYVERYHEISAELDCKFYSSCLLEDTLESSGYRRQRLLDMSDAIRIDLIRSEIMAGICLSLESRSPSDTERENNYLNEGVVKSADKIYNWIPPSLEVAWPRITALFVQRAIEATPNIDRKNYQSLAEEILTIAQERGPPDFTYQVLVTDASLQTETVCNSHSCLQIRDLHSIDTFVLRHEKNGSSKRLEANQWIAANKYNIIEVFRENGSSDSLNQTLHALDRQVGLFGNNSFFKTAVLIRNNKFLASQCTIETGMAAESLDRNSIAHIEYFTNGLTSAKLYKLFVFI